MIDKNKLPKKKRVRQKEGDTNYVNNKKFHDAMLSWNYDIIASHYDCVPEPILPNHVAEMIIKIVRRYASCHNFYRYTWKDEMIGDGIYTCMLYATKYNCWLYDNPFAYFTRVAERAFIKRIRKEQGELRTKARYLQTSGMYDSNISKQIHDEDGNSGNVYIEFLRSLNDMTLPEQEKNTKKIKKPIDSNVCEMSALFT